MAGEPQIIEVVSISPIYSSSGNALPVWIAITYEIKKPKQ